MDPTFLLGYFFFFIIAAIVITSKSVNLAKKAHGEVLKQEPITSDFAKELLGDKEKKVNSAILFVSIVLALGAIVINKGHTFQKIPSLYTIKKVFSVATALPHIALSTISIFVCFYLFKWMALWIGLKTKSLFLALSFLIVGWIIIPGILPAFHLLFDSDPERFYTLLSPIYMAFASIAEFPGTHPGNKVISFVASILWHGWLCLLIKRHCFYHAHSYLES